MSRAHPRHSPIERIKTMRILIVNPDMAIRHLVEKSIPEKRRVRISLALSDDLSTAPDTPPPDVVLFNIKAEAWSNLNRLWRVCDRWPVAQIIFLSPLNDIHLWAEAIRLGAYDFLPTSIDPDQLKWVLQGAFARRRGGVEATAGYSNRKVATN